MIPLRRRLPYDNIFRRLTAAITVTANRQVYKTSFRTFAVYTQIQINLKKKKKEKKQGSGSEIIF